MRVVKKNVYYCDFCNKRALRSLKTHEAHCTANPDRACRLCEGKSVKEIIEKYRKRLSFDSMNYPTFFKKRFTLRDIVNELDYICPNCIFTIIRCLGLNTYRMAKNFKYDYKKALDNWWKAVNKIAYEEERREMYDY